jgi:F-type H+-transporting ATPase subunit delta
VRALADLATKSGELEEVGDELEQVCRILESNPVSKSLFLAPEGRPRMSWQEQSLLLRRILEALEIGELARDFLLLLLRKGRLPLLAAICHRYRELADALMNRVRVTLSVPFPLDPEDLNCLQEVFHHRIRKEVILKQQPDPSLLGGWRAQVGSGEVWDASLRGELERLKSRLLRNEGSA